jgi:putative exporter of polyketide antibiotics
MPGTHHLFAVTRWLLRVATLFSLFLIAVLSLALGALVLAMLGLVHLPIPANEVQGMAIGQIFEAGALAVAAGIFCIALAAYVFLLTARIIDTASAGDPFVTENADRLNRIACLLLAMQAVGLLFNLVMNLFPDKIADNISFGFDVSANGILAALLIFVLAQIFRRGSEMRNELEGTV